jgi:RNA polymerase subunit RPABC4/transcription elongation factor Spt4
MNACAQCGRLTPADLCTLCEAERDSVDLVVIRGAQTGRIVGLDLAGEEAVDALRACELFSLEEMTPAEARAAIEEQSLA